MNEVHPSDDEKIHDAIERRDFTWLSAAYTEAANKCEQRGSIDEACFFLTQAYVYALQEGLENAATIHARLKSYKRES